MTLALRAKGRRFNSGSAHFPIIVPFEYTIFSVFMTENCVIRCFKWFSNVLLRLKPRSLDSLMVSLSRYKTKLLLFEITFAPARKQRDILCYMCNHSNTFTTINANIVTIQDTNNIYDKTP